MSPHKHDSDPDRRRLWLAVIVNIVLTLAQVAGGIIAGSLALIADALHNLSDAGSLLLALIARRIARRPADEVMTFGYGRAEIVAALINFTTLIVIGVYLIYEALARAIDPQPIVGWIVVIVATVALVIDLITAWLTYSLSRKSMNVRAAFLHNATDALASVGVIMAGTLVILFDWRLADPIVTLLIAGYVLYHGISEIGSAIRILMSGTPAGSDVVETIRAMEAVEGVVSVHHVHLWAIDEHRPSLEAHVVTEILSGPAAEALKARLKAVLRDQFDIAHTTLELEYSGGVRSCDDEDKGSREVNA
jgi:cobalt-zinc-cadmium efflux system protein